MEGPAKTATSAYPGRVYFDKKALTKLDNNLAVLKGVKQGEQLRSWGDGHLHIDNRWMRSYPDLNAEDVEWTLRHVEWLLLAKGESSSTEEDLYLLELAGRV